ncbi:Long-chain-fatty-acid--CoA ligase 1 [Liparis tanakae]|uniref:Long-chain-fatty-acid--CoA ligase n=1 Tax=Liparis tanakae TaxID=230148 RepID=A0A4Z2H8Y9_9TELE|nr:Long-chain-fatty-acid--CoA ligase 1 [Liparis tanakae]
MPGGERARRSALNDSDEHMTHYYNDARTLYEAFQRGLRESNDGPCLGSRKPNQPYEWQSYSEVVDRAENVGSALLHKGHSRTGDKFIGIFSQNRPEWTISELACYTYSMVAVPLYDTLGTEALGYIIHRAAISTVICDVPEKAKMILDCVEGNGRTVKTIVLMEPFDSELVTQGQEWGIDILSLKDFEALGQANLQKPVPPQPEDLALICFTSGTTGDPKGAMLTHGNVISNTAAFMKMTEGTLKPTSKDVQISFLPLAHMFERVVEVYCTLSINDIHVSYLPLAHMFERVVQGVILIHGARIGYFQGDIRLLMDDLKTLQPTVFPVVPRLLNRMFDKASLGGRVRLIITGAAPVSPTILTFLRAALGCQFYEGYGQTECTAGCSMSMPGDWSAGHVGPPLACNAIKLLDVAEMNYLAANGEGEVCVKGPNVFQGYLKDPERTAEAIDKDGWLHTGDIGKWLPSGTLKIIDRKKHIFKLAQGEYIAPEKIETVYSLSDPVVQVFVHGESLKACLVGIVVPDPDFLPIWSKKKGIDGSYSELCRNKDVKNAILEDMLRLGKDAGLKSFEQVRDIALHPEMFSIQNGLLTPTLKAKRTELRSYFKEQIDELYAKV